MKAVSEEEKKADKRDKIIKRIIENGSIKDGKKLKDNSFI